GRVCLQIHFVAGLRLPCRDDLAVPRTFRRRLWLPRPPGIHPLPETFLRAILLSKKCKRKPGNGEPKTENEEGRIVFIPHSRFSLLHYPVSLVGLVILRFRRRVGTCVALGEALQLLAKVRIVRLQDHALLHELKRLILFASTETNFCQSVEVASRLWFQP